MGNTDALTLLRGQQALNFSPGTDQLYRNSDSLLLAAIVEAVTESGFAAVSAERFRGWGMPNTGYFTDYLQVIPGRARSYGSGKGWREYPRVAALHGDGGLFTTLPDQLAWEVRLQRTPRTQRAGDDSSLERTTTRLAHDRRTGTALARTPRHLPRALRCLLRDHPHVHLPDELPDADPVVPVVLVALATRPTARA